MKEIEKLSFNKSFTCTYININLEGTLSDIFCLKIERRAKKIDNIYSFDVFIYSIVPNLFFHDSIYYFNSRNIHYHSRLNEKDSEKIKDILIEKLPEIKKSFIRECF